jgi:hypothetical protein
MIKVLNGKPTVYPVAVHFFVNNDARTDFKEIKSNVGGNKFETFIDRGIISLILCIFL